MKLKTVIFLAIFLLSSSMASANDKKLSITCSLFPVYDFSREITSGRANVNLLLRPGVEPHEFEPSPMDIKSLNDSDVFIFTGKNMETWAEKISGSLSNVLVIDASEGIEIFNNDPHIWLDLSFAQKMIMNIMNGLCKADPSNAKFFKANAENLCSKISELDKKFMAMKKDKVLIFAGEFAYNYFIRRYGFEYLSAYDGENEPSVRRMAEVLKYIKENKARYIFSDAFGISAITRSISEQSGAEILIFNSMENFSSDEDGGPSSFFEIMNSNYEAIKLVIND